MQFISSMSRNDPLALTPDALAALEDADAYPEDPSASEGVSSVQTHISRVFLTGDRVYKFRKPVDLGFLNFASRSERNQDCLREVALNRRLAPDVYLGVAPLLEKPIGFAVGSISEELAIDLDGTPLEHCVVMRRLPDGRDALSLLKNHELTDAHIDRIAECLAAFHLRQRLGCPAPIASEAWLARCAAPVEANFRSLASAGLATSVDAVARRSYAFLSDHADRLERRRREGRVVDGHGDLHLDHLWFEGDDTTPRIIDCIEFDEELRQIDAASDVAFLAMDLRYRGAERLAERMLRRYACATDDFGLYSVVDFFQSYRATVRAKVAAIAAADRRIAESQRKAAEQSVRRHLDLANSLITTRAAGTLVAVGGCVGSGKSTIAEAIADATGGVVISSDRLRKQLAGLSATERGNSDLYRPEFTECVYREMLERARDVSDSGRVTVLDATFAKRRHRDEVRAAAREWGVDALLVNAHCQTEVALVRLARRAAAGRDASDAGPELLARSEAEFEQPAEWPTDDLLEIHTDRDWSARLAAICKRLG